MKRRPLRIDVGVGSVDLCGGQVQPRAARKVGPPRIWVRVSEDSLCQQIVSEIAAALCAVREAKTSVRLPEMVGVHSAQSVSRNADKFQGALALVDITLRRPETIRRIVRELDAAGCAGIQLVYGKPGPLPEPLEEVVFEVLEERRGHKDKTPTILTRKTTPLAVWQHVLARKPVAQGKSQ